MGIDKGSPLAYQRDTGVGENLLDTGTQLGNDRLLTLAGLVEGGTMDVGLRGDAAHVQACAANMVALEHDNRKTCLGG